MPIDPQIYADQIGDSNVADAVRRGFKAIHDRLNLLEASTGANPQTQVDAPSNPPPSQNPPPANPSSLSVQFNQATGFYTVTVTAPWNVRAPSGSALSRQALQSPPAGVVATFHLESSLDPTFETGVTDYGVGAQHVFTVPGPAGLFFRVETSIDGGQTFGETSPAKNANEP